jgi:hypothetical protein
MIESGTFSRESLGSLPRLHEAERAPHELDAVLDPPEQVLNLACASLCAHHIKRGAAAKTDLRASQPRYGVPVIFEYLLGQREDPRHAVKSVALHQSKPLLQLALMAG